MDNKKCECGRRPMKDSNYCFFCSPDISDLEKVEARAKGGRLGDRSLKKKLDPDIKNYLPIQTEQDLSRFLNRLLSLAADAYLDDFEKFLTQSLRIVPRLNDLMTYQMLSELRERVDELKARRNGHLLESNYVDVSQADRERDN